MHSIAHLRVFFRMQEVDDKVFFDYLQPHLAVHGYAGHYTNKMGKVKEGSATFYNLAAYDCQATKDIKLRDSFKVSFPVLGHVAEPRTSMAHYVLHVV